MNVALRSVHDTLARGAGDPAGRMRSLTEWLVAHVGGEDVLEPETLRGGLRSFDVGGTATSWRADLRSLGVLTPAGRLDPARAEAVADALDLAGDSFLPVGPASSWAPVATLPAELRALLRPPPLRQTAGVLLELVDRARTELTVATPFVDARGVDFLADALVAAGHRGTEVRIVTSLGQAGCFETLARRWADGPHAALRVTEVHTQLSSLGSHAKVLVVDYKHGYVGSANLTGAGLGRHVEIGVVLTGAQVAELAKVLAGLERLGTPAITVRAGAR